MHTIKTVVQLSDSERLHIELNAYAGCSNTILELENLEYTKSTIISIPNSQLAAVIAVLIAMDTIQKDALPK